jgi:hypothetical protein
MSVKAKKEPLPAPEAAASPLGSVDQIRDILFGAQMRDYEVRFSALETRLIDEARALRDDIQKRFQTLEKNLEAERGERGQATDKVIDELRATAKSMSERADQDRKDLRDELAAARDAIVARLDSLQGAKTDRAALSQMLRGMAAELENGATASADHAGKRR